ncbi:MAG: cytochrome c biogenesis protein ResB [Fibrobacterota bacterium]
MKKTLQTLGSLKIALWLFFALGAVSLLGVIVPQRPGSGFLHDLYNSVPFLALLFLCALNLTVCVITRITANLAHVFKKEFIREPENLRAMKHHRELDRDGFADTAIIHLTKALQQKGYSVKENSDEDRRILYASKGVLSKVGSIVLHLGVLVLFAGGLVSSRMGYVDYLKLGSGAAAPVRERPFTIHVDDFRIVLNKEGKVKSYETDAELKGKDGKTILKKTIRVNDPLIHDGIHFYQSSYEEAPASVHEVRLRLTLPGGPDTTLTAVFGTGVSLPRGNTLYLHDYFCDFSLDMKTREPSNRSANPDNPALMATLMSAEGDTIFQSWLFFNHPEFHGMRPDNPVRVTLESYRPEYQTVLQVRKNPGVPFILTGILMASVGLLLLLYVPVRRVYALALTAQGRTRLLVSGTSSRFEGSFIREFGAIVDGPPKEGA